MPNSNQLEGILQQFSDEHKSITNSVIQNTPSSEMWRYFVDYPADKGILGGDMQNIGWLPFTEKNYLTGLTKAFHSMLTTQQLLKPDSPEFSEELVEILLKLQKNSVFNVLPTTTIGFCQDPIELHQLNDERNSTLKGFKELLSEIKKDSHRLLLFKIYIDDSTAAVRYLTNFNRIEECKSVITPENNDVEFEDIDKLSEEKLKEYYRNFVEDDPFRTKHTECSSITISMEKKAEEIVAEKRARVKEMIETYQNSIKNPKSNMQDRLTAIAKLTTDLVKYHPFSDGNARSIAILLLNFLLKQNGFPPAIINPNFSGGYSQQEWESEILDGMQRALILASIKYLPCVKTSLILENATPEKKREHEEAVETERLGRKIRKLYKMIPTNEFIKPIIDYLEKFLHEEKLTKRDLSSMKDVCDKIIRLKSNVNTEELKNIFSDEIKKLSSNSSSKLFTESADLKLQIGYQVILERMNGKEPENVSKHQI